jgi:hypothetical protein
MINEGESHKKQRLMQTPYTGAEAVGKLLKNFGQISEAVSRFGNTLNAIHIAAENIEHEFRNLASMMSMTRYSMSMSNNSPMYGAGAKRTNFPSPQERLIEFEVVERAKNNIRDQLKQERGEQPFKDNATRLDEYESFLEEKEAAYKNHKARMDDLYKRDGKEPVTTETKINEYQKFLDEKYTRLQTYLKKELDLFATMQKARGLEKVGINKLIFEYEESLKSQNKRKNNNKNNNSGSDYVSGSAPDYSEMPAVPKKKAAIVVLDFETAGAPGADIQKDKNDYVKSADIIQIAAEFRDDVGNVLETFNVFLDKRSKEITLPSKQGLGGDKFAGLQKAWQEAKDSGSMVTMEDAAAKLKSIIDSIVVPGVTKFVVKDTFDTEIVQNNDTDKNKLLQPVLGPFMQNSDVIDVQDVFKQLFEKEKELDPSKQSATQRAMADVDSTSGGTNYDKQVFTIETMFAALKPELEKLANELNESSTDLGKFHNALGDVRIESLLYLFAQRKLKTIAKEAATKNPNPTKGSKGNTTASTNTSPKKPNNTYSSNSGVQKVEVVAPLPLPVIIVGGGGNFGSGGGSNGGNGAPPFTLTFPMVDDKWIEKSIEALRKERQNDEARKAGGKPASKKNTTNTTNDFSGGKPSAPNDNFVSDSIVDQIINGTMPSNTSSRKTSPTANSYSPIKDPDFVPSAGTPKTEQQVRDEEAYERQNRSTTSFIDPVTKPITVDPNQPLVESFKPTITPPQVTPAAPAPVAQPPVAATPPAKPVVNNSNTQSLSNETIKSSVLQIEDLTGQRFLTVLKEYDTFKDDLKTKIDNILKVMGLLDEKGNKNFKMESGGNSTAIMLGDKVLLSKNVKEETEKEKIKLHAEATKKGLPTAQVQEFFKNPNREESETNKWINFVSGYEIQSKASGNLLHKTEGASKLSSDDRATQIGNEADEILKATQQQIIDFYKNWSAINSMGLQIDPSKASNFLFDQEKGFQFIDVEKREAPLRPENQLLEFINVMANQGPLFRASDNHEVFGQVAALLKHVNDSLLSANLIDKPLNEHDNINAFKQPNINKAFEALVIADQKKSEHVATTPPAPAKENKKIYTNEEIIAALRKFEKESESGKYDGKIVNGKLIYEDVQLPPEIASLEKESTLFNQSYNKGDVAAFEKFNSATIQREKGGKPNTFKSPEIIFNNINGIGRSSTSPSSSISNILSRGPTNKNFTREDAETEKEFSKLKETKSFEPDNKTQPIAEPTPPPKVEAPLSKIDKLRAAQKDVTTPEPVAPPKPKAKPAPTPEANKEEGYYAGKHGIEFGFDNQSSTQTTSSDFINNFIQGIPKQKVNGVEQPPITLSDSMQDMMRAFQDIMLPVLNKAKLDTTAARPGAEGTAAFDTLSDSAQKLVSNFQKMFGLDLTKISNFSASAFGPDATKNNKSDSYVPQGLFNKQSGSIKIQQTANEKGKATDNSFGTLLHESIHAMFNQLRKQTKIPQLGQIADINFDDITGGNKEQLKAIEEMYTALVERAKTAFIEAIAVQDYGDTSPASIKNATKDFEGMEYYKKPEELIATLIGDTFRGKDKQEGLLSGKNKNWLKGRRKPKDEENTSTFTKGFSAVKNFFGFGNNTKTEEMADEQVNNKTSYSGDNSEVFKRDVSTASYEQLEADLERIGDLLQGPAKNSPLFLKMARTQEAKVKDQLAKLETIKRNTGEVVTPEQMDLEREAKLQTKSEKISKAPQTVSSDFYKGELAGSNAPPVVIENKKEEEKLIKTESNSEKNTSGQKQERGENISLMEALSQSFDRLTGKAYKKGYDPNETFDKRSERVSSIASGAKDKASILLDNFNKVPGIIENALIASVKIPFTTKKQTDDERINGSKTYQYSGFKMDEQGNSIETKRQVTANSWQEAVKKVNEQSGIFVENLEELNGGIQGFIRNTLRPEDAVLNQNDEDTKELSIAKTAMQDNAMVNSNSDGSLTEEGQLKANSLLELISDILAVIRDKSIQGPIHPEMRQDFVGPRLPESESVPSVKDQRNLDTSIPDTVSEDIITKPGVNNSPTVPVQLLNNQSTTPNASPYSFSPLDIGALLDPNAKPDLPPSDTSGESSGSIDVNVLNIGDIKPAPAPFSDSSNTSTTTTAPRAVNKNKPIPRLAKGGIIGQGVNKFISKGFGSDEDEGPKYPDIFPRYLAQNEAVLPENAVKKNARLVGDLLKGKKIKYMKKGGMGGGGSAPTASSSSSFTAAPKFDPRVFSPKGDIFGPIKQWVSDFANNTRLGFIGKSVMDFGKALQGTLNGLAGFVKAASPDTFSTLTGSIQLLMGAIGVQFIPIILRVSACLQQWYQEILTGEGVLGEFVTKIADFINSMPDDMLEQLVGIGLVVAGVVALAPVFAGLMAVVGIVAGGFSLMLTVITVVGTIIRGFGLMLGWGIGMVRAFGARLATAGGGTGFGAMMVGVARLIGPLAALLGAIKGITDYWNKKNLKDAEKKSQSLEEQEMETTVFKGEEEQKFAEERARLAGEGGKTKEEKVATLKKEEDHLFNEAQVKFEEAKKQSKGGGIFDKNTQVRPITETEAFKEYQSIKRKQNAVQQQREIEEGTRKGFTENAEKAGEEKKQKLREEFAVLPGKTVNQYGQSKEVAEDHIKYRSGEIDKAVTKRSMNVTEGKSVIQPVQQGMANLGGGPVSLLSKELLGVVPELPKLPNMDDITAGFGDLNKKLKDAVSGLLTSGPNGKGKDSEYDRGVGLDKGLEKGRINDKEYKKQLEANNRRMTRIGTKDEAADDKNNAIKFGKYNAKYTKQKEGDAEREKESTTKALAMSFQKEKAQASFSSVDEAYKKIQVSALGDDPMTAEMKKLNEVSMVKLLETLRGMQAGDKQNADKIVAGGGLAK